VETGSRVEKKREKRRIKTNIEEIKKIL